MAANLPVSSAFSKSLVALVSFAPPVSRLFKNASFADCLARFGLVVMRDTEIKALRELRMTKKAATQMTDSIPLTDVNAQLQSSTPQQILTHALQEHEKIAISFSGAEDVVLVHMAAQIKPDVEVFCLDTGRLHAETYAFIESVRKHYDIKLEILFPDQVLVQQLVNQKGLFSFYEDDHKECCSIRKVGPLRKKLLELDAWITGQRRDQSPGTRAAIPVVQPDRAFSRPGETLVKYNPLSNWSSAQVWDYIRAMDIPFNPLHERGYISIGCEPCTRPVSPGQHERAGRWWWEEATKKECGLHETNLKQ